MKKLLLFATVGAIAVHANGQHKSTSSVMSGNSNPVSAVRNTSSSNLESGLLQQGVNNGVSAQKTTVGGSRWYNQVEAYAEVDHVPNIYIPSLTTFTPLWQDSSVVYDNSAIGIAFLSVAQLFHPQSPLYNDETITPNSVGKIAVENNKPYVIDSVKVRGWYERTNSSYVDTLIFTIIQENNTSNFFYTGFVGDPFVGPNNIDSIAFLLWRTQDYGVVPITQVPYGSGGNFLTGTSYKVPLNDAVFEDSVENLQFGGYIHEIGIPTGLSVLAGKKASISVTFKSGTNYIHGDPISNYNFFTFMNHETIQDADQWYVTEDLNMSFFLHKDTTNMHVNSTLAYMVPAVSFQEGFNELVNISWKVTCATCDLVGSTTTVRETGIIQVGDAHPNPAQGYVNIPVTLKENADVQLTLVNAIGQTVYSENLGRLSANQTKVAVISTQGLPNGVYIYSVIANGTRLTNRIVVSH